MKVEDVTATLEMALEALGCDQAYVRHKPRLLSDNGPSYIAGDLADWLDASMADEIDANQIKLASDKNIFDCYRRPNAE